MNESIPIFITCLATLIVNIPFGFFRAGYRKLSFMWFVFIHLPVPLVILIRYLNGIDLSWTLAPFLFGSYFTGQWIGKKLRNYRDIKNRKVKESRINS